MTATLNETAVAVESGGQRIHGMLHLPRADMWPCAAVLLLHGFTGCADGNNRILVRQARHLAEVGLAALRFDFRGSGESEGEFHEMTLGGELGDAKVMLEWLSAQHEVDTKRLGVLGFSMGGSIAGCLLGAYPSLRSAVLWAPVAHPFEYLTALASAQQRDAAQAVSLIDTGGEGVGNLFLQDLPSIRPLDALRGTHMPVRVVHGTGDTTVPLSEGTSFIHASDAEWDLVLIDGANHSFESLAWRTQLRTVTTEWFLKTLGGLRPSPT